MAAPNSNRLVLQEANSTCLLQVRSGPKAGCRDESCVCIAERRDNTILYAFEHLLQGEKGEFHLVLLVTYDVKGTRARASHLCFLSVIGFAPLFCEGNERFSAVFLLSHPPTRGFESGRG